MSAEAIGLLGAFLLLAAWLYETIHTYKSKDKLDLKFVAVYIIATATLLVYSYLINSIPFIILNGAILVVTLVELELSWRRKKK